MDQSIETESNQSLPEVEEWLHSGNRASFWGDENILELDNGSELEKVTNPLRLTHLHICREIIAFSYEFLGKVQLDWNSF